MFNVFSRVVLVPAQCLGSDVVHKHIKVIIPRVVFLNPFKIISELPQIPY